MSRGGFTLIEMLVATVVAAMLTGGVLLMVSALSRDRARLAAADNSQSPDAIVELIRRDVTNAQAMSASIAGDRLVLIGHGGIDPNTLVANGRLSRVVYRVERGEGQPRLVREQRYLDDRTRPEPWRDVVARDVERVLLTPATLQIGLPSDPKVTPGGEQGAKEIPARLWLRVQRSHVTIEEELAVR